MSHSFAKMARCWIGFVFLLLAAFAAGQNTLSPSWVVSGCSTPYLGPTYSTDGTRILVAPFRTAVSVYNVSDGKLVAHLSFDSDLTGACLSSDGSTLYYGTSAGQIFRYDIATQAQTRLLNVNEAENDGPFSMVVSHDGKTLAYLVSNASSYAFEICLYSLTTNTFIKRFDYSNNNTFNGSSSLGFCNGDTNVYLDGPTIYDFTGRKLASVADDREQLVIASPDEETLYAYNNITSLFQSYNASTLAIKWAAPIPNPSINGNLLGWRYWGGSVSNDGKAIYFSNADNTRNWYVAGLSSANGSLLSNTINAHPGASSASPVIAASPTTNKILIGPENEPSAQMWNVDTQTGSGTLTSSFFGGLANYALYPNSIGLITSVNGSPIQAVSVEEYHANFATSQTIRNAQTGDLIKALPDLAVVSPDGLYYALENGSVLSVYDTASGTLIATGQEGSSLSAASGIYWAGDKEIAVSDGFDVYVLSFNPSSKSLANVLSITGKSAEINSLWRLSSDGTLLVIGLQTQAGSTPLSVYNVHTGTLIGTISPDPNYQFANLSISSNDHLGLHERSFGANEYLSTFRVVDISTSSFKTLQTFTMTVPSSDSSSAAALSPDGQMVAMGTYTPGSDVDPREQGKICLYQVSTGKILAQWTNQFVPDLNSFFFSADSREVLWTSGGAIVATPVSSPSPSLTLSSTSVGGGAAVTGTVTIPTATTTDTVVTLSSGTAFTSVPASVTITAGKTAATFSISTTGVSEVISSPITATLGGGSLTMNLVVNPASALTLSFSPSSVVGRRSATGIVTLNAAAGPNGAVVNLTSYSPLLVSVPLTVTVPPNATQATFRAATTIPAADTPVTIKAWLSSFYQNALLTVLRPHTF